MEGAPPTPAGLWLRLPICHKDQRGDHSCDMHLACSADPLELPVLDARSCTWLKHFLRPEGCPVAPTTPLRTAQCLGQHSFFLSLCLQDLAARCRGARKLHATSRALSTCRVNAHHCRHCRGRPDRVQAFSAPRPPTRATKSSRIADPMHLSRRRWAVSASCSLDGQQSGRQLCVVSGVVSLADTWGWSHKV